MSKHPFDLLMELHTNDIRLDCAALHLARDRYPQLNVSHYLRQLDHLAERVAAKHTGLAAPLRYNALREVLVNEAGFTGDSDSYYDAENCHLNRVLDRRRGIPITTSIVWIEVARRLKWPVTGVALPGHFIIRIDDDERFLLIDPFHAGRPLSITECKQIVRRRFGPKFPFSRSYVKPVSARGILARLLRNLRNIYLAQDDLPRAADTLRRMTAMEPRNGRHLKDLAAICCRRGQVRKAAAHLRIYLDHVPHNDESELVRQSLRQLEAAVVALN